MMPPRIVRRLLFPPLLLVVGLALLVLLPIVALLALLAVPYRRWWRRALRLVWFGLTWLAMETAALSACLGLWVVSGFGGRLRSPSYQDRHYAIMSWFLGTVYAAAVKVFQLRVEIEEPDATAAELAVRLTRPVIVLSRHAGPGDSFLLIHHLLGRYGRRPRIVMKSTLQLDPGIDVVVNRLPHAFVPPQRRPEGEGESGRPHVEGPVVEQIRRLADDLGPAGALVIFPEGGNFTAARRRRGILRLKQKLRFEEARRAARMENLLPPRSGGVLAAVTAAPAADVIFVAHTGLDDLVTVRDVWRALPMEQLVRARWWRVDAAEVPRDRDELVGWLYDWWEHIDAWVAANRPLPSPGIAR